MYPVINDNNQLTLVIVGVDATGENMLTNKSETSAKALKAVLNTSTALLDEGQASPPYPPPTNGF
jgi:hypothetical protein